MTLISEDYRSQQEQMHTKEYGGTQSNTLWPMIAQTLADYGAVDVLDYGAGKGHLGINLLTSGWPGDYTPYDPGVAEFSETPQPHDFLCCIDVLEHIEPDCLDAVLADLKRVTKRAGFISVHLKPAKKTLPDGRNAHLIQKPAMWWLRKLTKQFRVVKDVPLDGKTEKHVNHVFIVEARP